MTHPDPILAPVAALTLPDAAALSGSAARALAFIESLPVATSEDYSLAADELQAIKGRAKALEDQRTSITQPLNAVLKAVNDLFRAPANTLAAAEATLKRKMLAYTQEQQRQADEARRRAEAEAAEQRRRQAEEAAQRQREAEAAAQAEAAARAAGNAQAAEIAAAAAQRAQAEAAAATVAAQVIVAAAPVVEVPKVKGIATSTRVDFEVTDLHALVRHVAAHPELLALIRADDVKLRAYVRGLGTAANLPGVRVFEAQSLSARAA